MPARAPWNSPAWGLLAAPLGWAYGAVMAVRRAAYRRELVSAHRFDRPVVSVGNLTVGGTGKTPFVSTVLSFLDGDTRALVLSRGFGPPVERDGITLNDEGHLLRRRHPEHRFAQGADRVAAAGRVPAEVSVIVLDDGAQHLRIRRDLDIILLDAGSLAAPRRLLPAGPWREGLGALSEADIVVLTRADAVTPDVLEAARRLAARHASHATVLTACHRPRELRSLRDGRVEALSLLRDRSVGAVSGIAAPDSFVGMLEAEGARVSWRLDFPDHAAYDAARCEELRSRTAKTPVDLLVVTEKDAVKLEGTDAPEAWALVIDLELDAPEVLRERLQSVTLARPPGAGESRP